MRTVSMICSNSVPANRMLSFTVKNEKDPTKAFTLRPKRRTQRIRTQCLVRVSMKVSVIDGKSEALALNRPTRTLRDWPQTVLVVQELEALVKSRRTAMRECICQRICYEQRVVDKEPQPYRCRSGGHLARLEAVRLVRTAPIRRRPHIHPPPPIQPHSVGRTANERPALNHQDGFPTKKLHVACCAHTFSRRSGDAIIVETVVAFSVEYVRQPQRRCPSSV